MKKNILGFLAVSAVLLFGTALSAAERENLTAKHDPGFESGKKYWYFYKKKLGGSFAPGKGTGGSSALVFASGEKLAEAVAYRKGFVQVKEGQIYSVEAKFRGTISRGEAALLVNFWTGTANGREAPGCKMVQTMNSKITEAAGEKWSTVKCTFKVPEKVNGVHIGFSATGMMGEIAFDDVKVYQASEKNEIPLIANAPALNGKADPEFMNQAAKLTDFVKYQTNSLAPDQTEVYLAMTTGELHAQILLYHDKKYPTVPKSAEHDSLQVFRSDCIEFFITYTGRKSPYYQICINSSGNIYDSLGLAGQSWESGIKTAVGKLNDSCDLIAFSIPLKDLGYNHELDKGLITPSWKINFARNHRNCEKGYSSTWKSLTGSFHDIQFFDWFIGMSPYSGNQYSDRFHNNTLSGNKEEKKLAFWPVKNKEYESLFSNEYSPYRGRSAYIWFHPTAAFMKNFALQYGMEYSRELMMKEYEKGNLIPYVSRESLKECDETMWKYVRETKNGLLLYFPYDEPRATFSCIYNPVDLQGLYDWTRNTLKKYPGLFWGVTIGDEATEHLTKHMINAINNPERLAKDPYLQAAVKEIREKYGYGKFGAPSSPKAKERFQWIAVKKYVFAKTLEIQKELYKICQEFTGPDGQKLVSVSSDPIGGLNIVQNQTREKDHCDIFTAQCLPQYSSILQTISFTTKMLRDMTGKTIWPCVHFEPYFHAHDSETTAAYLSEVARGGGTGLQIWNCDYVGKVRNMGCSEIDYYGHRPRWDTMLDIVQRFQTMPLLKYPEPDFAYYLSNETINSYWAPLFEDCEALFSLLGPAAGTWFRFICGNQLEDKDTDLNKWKTAVIAKADIELPENQKKFLDYVKNGGTLICFDPEVFSYSPDSSRTDAAREEIFGAKTIPSDQVLFRFVNHPYTEKFTREIISITPGFALKPEKGTEVLAEFMNKTAAATMKKYPGGGKAILFASAVRNSYITQKEWQDLIRQLAQTENIRTDHKIWNFSFPYKKEVKPEITEKCYTNNFFYWWINEPVMPANVKLSGAYYEYNIAPDNEENLKFTFEKGRLTNRIPALTAGDLTSRKNRGKIRRGELKVAHFADTWTKTEPLKIRFNFNKKIPIAKIAVYYNGSLPALTAVAPDGKSYQIKGGTAVGVNRLELKIPETLTDSIDLIIDQRSENEKITLSEVEIFGKP